MHISMYCNLQGVVVVVVCGIYHFFYINSSVSEFQQLQYSNSRKYTAGSIQVTNTVVEPVLLAMTPCGTEGTEGGKEGKGISRP